MDAKYRREDRVNRMTSKLSEKSSLLASKLPSLNQSQLQTDDFKPFDIAEYDYMPGPDAVTQIHRAIRNISGLEKTFENVAKGRFKSDNVLMNTRKEILKSNEDYNKLVTSIFENAFEDETLIEGTIFLIKY